ncbi:Intersectin 1 (SH3 domain protein) [Lunasporangiospora selenospora]|uniref:Intersectin 1 (SH3 domain protein) n=1 Tax=Lunasporangiospora selenospora TaxID=979761 RepID=A0A9P6G1U0_9FUNG|nr:Intersectin 1 (SH3 domain protein) [Lunasporangiospora selenospora]
MPTGGSGIPPPPPMPQAGQSASSQAPRPPAGDRGALLGQIQAGFRLKKATTRDSSGVKGVGRIVGEENSSSSSASAPRSEEKTAPQPVGMPGLGGMFANGMPTLKKSSGIPTGREEPKSFAIDHDSRRESTDWFGRLASHAPNDPVALPAPVPAPEVAPVATAAVVSSPETSALSVTATGAPSTSAEEPIEAKVDFSSGYRAKALWSYSAVAPEQISFEANDYIKVFQPKDSSNVDWVYGVTENDENAKGWLPKTYIQQIADTFKAKALFSYAGQGQEEISVERGDIVEVLEKPDPQWWRVQTEAGAIGMLPSSYLEEYIPGQPVAIETPISRAKALYSYTGQSSEELTLEVDDEIEILEKPDPVWWRARNDKGQTGMIPATYLEEVEGQSTSAAETESESSEPESSEEEEEDEEEDEESDSESDGGSDNDHGSVNIKTADWTSTNQLLSASTPPAIIVANAPKYRPAPPRPALVSRSASTGGLSTSAPSAMNLLVRNNSAESFSSHLAIPSDHAVGSRPRSGSHSMVGANSGTSSQYLTPSHPKYVSEGDAWARQVPERGTIRRTSSQTSLSSSNWSSTVDPEMLGTLSEKERKRQEAIHELIATEQVYLNNLYLIRDDFQRPLVNQGLLTPAESELVFKDWQSLLDLSQSIVNELKQRQVQGNGEGEIVTAVGDVINEHIVERSGCFLRYCASQKEASVLLSRRMKESRLLAEFLEDAKKSPACRGLDLSSFLLQPFQRITRYPLLISKILQYTETDHIDHLLLSEAHVSAEQCLGKINETLRTSETREQLEDVQRKMSSSQTEGLVLTRDTKHLGPRLIIHEGSLRKAKSGRRLYGYLFNDLLLLFLPGRDTGHSARAGLRKVASQSSIAFSSGASNNMSTSFTNSTGERSSTHDSMTHLPGALNESQGWSLYREPIPLERVRVKTQPGEDLRFTIVITSPKQSAQPEHYAPMHLQGNNRQPPQQTMIHVKANSEREWKAWIRNLEKAAEALAKAPRAGGMRTSIRPPLAETVGTMTIRVLEGMIPSTEFAKSKSFQCTLLLGEQLFTTHAVSSDHPYMGTFTILWRESVIFAVMDPNQVMDVNILSTNPFSPDTFMGSTQICFRDAVLYGERGVEVLAPVHNGAQVKLHMSYRVL